MEGQSVQNSTQIQGIGQQSHALSVANEGFARHGGGNINGNSGIGSDSGGVGTILFVGDLHWWTTDAELEAELCKYGNLKEVKFFDDFSCGQSKGYCQVEFYDPSAATACKVGMNGHIFNGRPCVVAHATPNSVRQMGEAQVKKKRGMMNQATLAQASKGVDDTGVRSGGSSIAADGNCHGRDTGRSFGRGSWGRGNAQGIVSRGQVGLLTNIIGSGGNGFGQGIAATPALFHPQTMMGHGFDPAYGAHMGRMGGYGGFLADPTPPFPGTSSPFLPVGGMGLPGVAPHVNPAFFRRGMPENVMGIMPATGVEGHNFRMWTEPSASGWGSEEQGGRAGEPRYGEDPASDHDSETGRDWGRKHYWDRDRNRDWDRDWYREDRNRYSDHKRYRDPEPENNDEWDQGQSSRTQSKSRLSQEEGRRSRKRDAKHRKM